VVVLPDQSRWDRIAPRIPFFAPVAVSGLNQCRAANLSIGGMGIIGRVATGIGLHPGDDLDLEVALAKGGRSLHAVGRVAWMSRMRADGLVGFGVQFRELPSATTTALATFLADHRPRVMVALAGQEQRQLARSALGDAYLSYVAHADELDRELVRGCSAILVYARDTEELTTFLDALWLHRPESGPLAVEPPLAPITVCTDIHSERLLPLFPEGKIYEVLRPPLDKRALGLAIQRARERWALQAEVRWSSLQLESHAVQKQRARRPTEPPKPAAKLVRVSHAMQQAYELMRMVATHDVPVLLAGESGTGKETFAREIHAHGSHAAGPFLTLDCSAVAEGQLESELFGRVRGAFPGGGADHVGLVELADGGTLFLRELQRASPVVQAKLLRVIEHGELCPVGSSESRRVDIRVLAAFRTAPREAVSEQRLRADLFYRLDRFRVALPPLRERVDDILPLARYFAALGAEAAGRRAQRIEPRMERALLAYDWPGNIRELRHAIERSLVLTPAGDPLRWATLPDDVRKTPGHEREKLGLDLQVHAFERRIIQMALDRNNGVIRRAARELEVNAITLARKMRRLGLDKAG